MKEDKYRKLKNKDKLKLLNELIVSLELKKQKLSTNEFIKMEWQLQMKSINEVKQLMIDVNDLNEEINRLISYAPETSDELNLLQLVRLEKTESPYNELIVFI